MQVRFVTTHDDTFARARIPFGRPVTVLQPGQVAEPTDIALFTVAPEAGVQRRQCLFMAPHRFGERGIAIPDWALATPFQVAIHPSAYERRVRNFVEALHQMAETYEAWDPHTPPSAPWNPRWHLGEVPASFAAWQERARQIVRPLSVEMKLRRHLTPVFEPSETLSAPTLLVIGCAAFNKPHTDVVDRLREDKLQAVVAELAMLINSGCVAHVQVVLAEGNIMQHEVLRMHLHPFMFMSVAEAIRQSGTPFSGPTRLRGRTHQRSHSEIAEAFDASAAAMVRQLVEPLRAKVSVSVTTVSWLAMLEPYLDEASVIIQEHQSLLETIYAERVRTRPSYATLHALDPAAGLNRTMGNAVLYVAEAMHLRDHPEHVVANCEVLDTYWRGLAPVLQPLWRDRTPYIGMIGEKFRQPWGY